MSHKADIREKQHSCSVGEACKVYRPMHTQKKKTFEWQVWVFHIYIYTLWTPCYGTVKRKPEYHKRSLSVMFFLLISKSTQACLTAPYVSLALCKVASVPCSPSIVYVFQLSLYNTRDSLWIPSLYLSGAVLNCWFTTLVFKYSNSITNTKESLLNTRQRYVCKLDNSAAITLWNKTKTEWLTKNKNKRQKKRSNVTTSYISVQLKSLLQPHEVVVAACARLLVGIHLVVEVREVAVQVHPIGIGTPVQPAHGAICLKQQSSF